MKIIRVYQFAPEYDEYWNHLLENTTDEERFADKYENRGADHLTGKYIKTPRYINSDYILFFRPIEPYELAISNMPKEALSQLKTVIFITGTSAGRYEVIESCEEIADMINK